VDKDRSGSISAVELAQFPFNNKPVGLDLAKYLIKAFDKDYTGNIEFQEFASLHQFMKNMQTAFTTADQDRSGFLDAREIHGAVVQAGFQLSLPTVQAISAKFGTPQRGVSFDQFLMICSHLAGVRTIFEYNDQQRSGRVTFTMDQLAHITVHVLP
jgi:Ca2+-binding EF-hand superfamily protein